MCQGQEEFLFIHFVKQLFPGKESPPLALLLLQYLWEITPLDLLLCEIDCDHESRMGFKFQRFYVWVRSNLLEQKTCNKTDLA